MVFRSEEHKQIQNSCIYRFFCKKYFQNGNIYRIVGPAEIKYYENTQIKYVVYYEKENFIHREDGPAKIVYYQDGTLKCKIYFRNDDLYMPNEIEPFCVEYDENGKHVYSHCHANNLKSTLYFTLL